MRAPFFPQSPAEAAAGLERLVTARELTTAQAKGLGRVPDRFWAALPEAPTALNHGDFCTPNTLWYDGQVVAPIAIDLDEVIKMAFGPGDPEERGPSQGAVRRIAASAPDAAGGPDVLVGYSGMLEMWVLENEPAEGEPDETDRANAAALRTAFAEGNGGCFAPLLTDIG